MVPYVPLCSKSNKNLQKIFNRYISIHLSEDEYKELNIKVSWGGGLRLGETSLQGSRGDKGDVGRQGEGGYPKKTKNGEMSFMDGP